MPSQEHRSPKKRKDRNQLWKDKIDVCTSYNEFNNLLSKARPKNSVVIAGMYNSLVNRILIGDHTKPGTKTMGKITFVNVNRSWQIHSNIP